MKETQDTSVSPFKARQELVGSLVARNLKIRYKSSLLGFFWSLLTPLCFILIYAAFARLLKFGGPNYLQYLVTGIVVWQFSVSCLNDSLYSIVGNANLVKKVFFPRVILPLSTALADGVNFLLTFAVLLVYLVASGHADFAQSWLLVPAFAMQLALCIGLACLCGTSNVFFRDTEHIVGVATQAWFFMSPIMYPQSYQTDLIAQKISAGAQWVAFLNPMTGILALYRRALLGEGAYLGMPPGPGGWFPPALSACVCIAVLAAGLCVLRAGDRRFGDVL